MATPKSRVGWLLIAGGTVAVAAVLYFLIASGGERVETVAVQSREVVELYVATGRVEAGRTSDVSAEIGGTVREVKLQEGDRVEEGGVLVALRPRDAELAADRARAQVETLRSEYRQIERGATQAELRAARAEVEEAEASVSQARRELERARGLADEGLATSQSVDQAQSAMEQARARLSRSKARLQTLREQPLPERLQAAKSRLEQAKVDLQRAEDDVAETTVRAPFAGLVLSVEADEGEGVSAGQAVARVADMESAEIYAEVDEDYFGRIEDGQEATLIFPSMPEQRFPAVVEQVGPEFSVDRGVVGVHLRPGSLPERVLPGLTVDVNIEVERLSDALAVPAEAVATGPEDTYVLVVEGGRATKRSVRVRARGEVWTAIGGVEAGQRVIRRVARVEPGAEVEAVATDDPTTGGGRE